MVVAGTRQPYIRALLAGVAVVLTLVTIVVWGNRDAISRGARQMKSTALDQVCNRDSSQPVRYTGKTMWTPEERPANTPIVGLLFVGRRRYMEILDCYVQRNLVKNGGWLDSVIWTVRTDIEEDVAFVKELVDRVPEYRIRIEESRFGYLKMYGDLDADTIYVKIDDDVVFVEDHTIPSIVTRLHQNPQYLLVSANVMNQPALSFVHYHLEAMHPYLPEEHDKSLFETDERLPDPTDWRLSADPYWYPEGTVRTQQDRDETLRYWEEGRGKDPRSGHRWLRLPEPMDILQTPVAKLRPGTEYRTKNVALDDWKFAAQQHYSFLENLEKDELWRYRFDLWHYFYQRLSINFIAFKGETLISNPINGWDDEGYITEQLTRDLRRPVVLDGTGVAVHFGFNLQTGTLNTTDLLTRYRLYAHEKVCGRRWGE